jgi:hypothetical protein
MEEPADLGQARPLEAQLGCERLRPSHEGRP